MAGSDWFDAAGNGAAVDVHGVAGAAAVKPLLDIVEAGALLSLSTTSDGGALGVTVTVDGRFRREYFRDEEGLVAWLAEAVPAVEAAKSNGGPSPAPRGRARRPQTR
jgi:hypothetical protein